jgi:hypothetical protein
VIPSYAVISRNGALKNEAYNNGGAGDVVGLETWLQFSFSPWSGWVSYTLSQGRSSENGGANTVSQYDQTHNLNLVASYDLNDDWRVGGRFRVVSGNPYTPIRGGVFDTDNQVYFPTRGAYFSERVSPFWQLDLRLDKKWVYSQWILTAYLDIQNVTNHRNVENISYSYDYSQNENVLGLPILPTLGLKGEF